MDSWWPNGVVFPPQPTSAPLDYQRPNRRQTSGRAVRRVRPERLIHAPSRRLECSWPIVASAGSLGAPTADHAQADRPQTALACAAALITQDAKLPQPIAAKPMRAKQPRKIFVDGPDRLFIRYRRPNPPVHVLHRLNFCLGDAHLIFTIPLAALSPCPPNAL